jgi:hypothetical protein
LFLHWFQVVGAIPDIFFERFRKGSPPLWLATLPTGQWAACPDFLRCFFERFLNRLLLLGALHRGGRLIALRSRLLSPRTPLLQTLQSEPQIVLYRNVLVQR